MDALPVRKTVFPKLTYGCEDIHKATNITEIHYGNRKVSHMAFINNRKVVLKTIWHFRIKGDTIGQFLMETFMLRQLNNPHLVKLLGFCARGYDNDRTKNERVLDKGIIGVYEFGSMIYLHEHEYTVPQLINFGQGILELIDYFQRALIGHIFAPDLKIKQFISVNGVPKLVDLEDFYAGDNPSCKANKRKSAKICTKYNSACIMDKCYNYNVKFNISQWVIIVAELFLYSNNLESLEAVKTLQIATNPSNITVESVKHSFIIFKHSVL